MTEECVSSSWLELESDPGLFTLLIDDFGVKGVQVEEIYDLSKPLENSIFGFIFLFKWIERRSRRSKGALLDPHSNYVTDPNTVNKMFFAHQIIPNSCATHALLSILLNCKSNKYLDLGDLLTKFRDSCQGLSPENKGYAIGNQPKLAEAHNSYAKPDLYNQHSTTKHGRGSNEYSFASSSATASSSMGTCLNGNQTMSASSSSLATASSNSSSSGNEIFHFICFVPINGRLYELDGLRPYPVDHGSLNESNNMENVPFNWTNKFKQIIRQRLNSFNSGQQNHEIRFNLMAVVPDKMIILHEQAELIKYNKKILNESINEFIEKDTVNNYTKIDKDILYSINKYEQSDNFNIKKEFELSNSIFNSSGLSSCSDMKSKLKQIDIASLNDELNNLTQVKSTTRQLRSNRLGNLKDDNLLSNKYDHFLFDVCFVSQNENLEEENGDYFSSKSKLFENIDLSDLCKQYKIESVKYTCKSESIEFNNDLNNESSIIINKLKLQLDNTYDINILTKKTNLAILKQVESKLEVDFQSEESKFNEEIEKRKKYKIDALRRKHIYEEFIVTYLNVLSESGKLAELIQNNGYLSNNSFSISNSNGSTKNNSICTNSTSKKLKKK